MTSALWRCQHEWLYSRILAAYGLPVAAIADPALAQRRQPFE
jgi:hypothetical protein